MPDPTSRERADADRHRRIDVHAHILPRDWPDLHERYGDGPWIRLEHHAPGRARMMQGERFFREIEANCFDPEARIEDLDRLGIDHQALSTVPVMFAYGAKAEHAHDLARFLNDHLAGACRDHPERFSGLGTLPMQDVDRALEELERCTGELGLAGIQIGTHVNGRNLDDPDIERVLGRCAELGACVLVHPWDMLAPERMEKYWLKWLVGMPSECALAIATLLLGGVLERHPGLRICFAHGGGAFPFILGRIEHGFRVRPDLVQVGTTTPPRELLDRFWVDCGVHDAEALRYLVRVHGVDAICLGSDAPFPLGEHVPGELVESLPDLDDDARRAVLWDNPRRFLGQAPADCPAVIHAPAGSAAS